MLDAAVGMASGAEAGAAPDESLRRTAPRVLVADAVEERTAAGIAAAIHRLIRSGVLAGGDRLPTVRELAQDLGVSPTTVSEAWQALSTVGAVQARGRAGTFVIDRSGADRPRRFLGIGAAPGAYGIDLSSGTPDPELLPPLREALERVTQRPGPWTTTYLDDPVLPELEAHLIDTWPFPPERLTVVDGALDALSRIVDRVVRLGDRVVVEDPGFPPLMDMLERAGAELLPVRMDAEGIIVSDLVEALASDPVALFLQPRAQNPTGTSMSIERAAELARALTDHDILVIEDDHSGDIATGADVSIGTHLGDRVVHIRSYSKSHGPDLRIAAVGGSARVIDPLVACRLLGPGWTSRLLQAVLLELLTDPAAVSAVARARSSYAMRGLALRAGLAGLGVTSTPGDGINAWVDVADERAALTVLAAQGVKVAPGTPFQVGSPRSDHVRVTTGLLHEDDTAQLQHILGALAEAARAGGGARAI